MRAKWITTGIAVLATVCGLGIASGSPANADSWSHADKHGDVAKLQITKRNFAVKAAPRDATTDITRLSVNHRPHRLVLRLQVRDLRRADARTVIAIVKTPTERHIVVVQSVEFAFVGKLARGRCPGLRKRFDYAADVITIGVPRHCLGKPSWVRVGVEMNTASDSSRADAQHFDDALSNRLANFDGQPTMSHRIHR